MGKIRGAGVGNKVGPDGNASDVWKHVLCISAIKNLSEPG